MTRYLDLAEYLWLSEQVTGVSADALAKSGRIDLADSALHAPRAGFGDEDFYPDIADKAAVLCWRLARNHPLPDGNTSAPRGPRSCCSSTSTTVAGTPIPPMSTTPNRPCFRSLRVRSTKQRSPTGYGTESSSSKPAPPTTRFSSGVRVAVSKSSTSE